MNKKDAFFFTASFLWNMTDSLAFPGLQNFRATLEYLGPNCTLTSLFQSGECRAPLFPVSCISLFVRVYREVINGKDKHMLTD